jgi:hypothetical protein
VGVGVGVAAAVGVVDGESVAVGREVATGGTVGVAACATATFTAASVATGLGGLPQAVSINTTAVNPSKVSFMMVSSVIPTPYWGTSKFTPRKDSPRRLFIILPAMPECHLSET